MVWVPGVEVSGNPALPRRRRPQAAVPWVSGKCVSGPERKGPPASPPPQPHLSFPFGFTCEKSILMFYDPG